MRHSNAVLARYTISAGDLVQFPNRVRPPSAAPRTNAELDKDPAINAIVQKYAHKFAQDIQNGGNSKYNISFDRYIGRRLEEWKFAQEFDDSVSASSVFHVARKIVKFLESFRSRHIVTGRAMSIRAVLLRMAA